MFEKKIDIPFKGLRTYIQGPDLYNVLMEEVEGKRITDIHFSVHDFIRKNHCRLYKTEILSDKQSKHPPPAQLKCNADGKEIFLFVEEDQLVESAPKRVKFDERIIQRMGRIDHESISIADISPFTFIETVVSMKKELMMHTFPDVKGKWIFTKINLKSRIEKRSNLKVKLLHNMQFKLIKSVIIYKSKIIGHLYFSLLES